MKAYFGDIHNHCNISYGHGNLEDALKNAARQLDFCSVTGHSSWADMPQEERRLDPVRDYHKRGFAKLEKNWSLYLNAIDKHNTQDLVTFPSYEWHSRDHGDHVFYFKKTKDAQKMIKPVNMEDAHRFVMANRANGINCFVVPHHIGYKEGYRGINWDTFYNEICPLVEIVSMHGGADGDDGPVPYYHTMGPRNYNNTMQAGLNRGYHFGVTGSTDHHSAHPGSYGYGMTGIWAEKLDRDHIWDGLINRRTWAVTGDKITLNMELNGTPMGRKIQKPTSPLMTYKIQGEYGLDRIEVLSDRSVLAQKNFLTQPKEMGEGNVEGKFTIEVGWGEKGICQNWDVLVNIAGGELLGRSPHFHGLDVVDPLDGSQADYNFSRLYDLKQNSTGFSTKTWGCPTSVTNGNQAMTFTVRGKKNTVVKALINGKTFQWKLEELQQGSQTDYLGGFLSGALRISRFCHREEYDVSGEFSLNLDDAKACYLRVYQKNGQYAWSSPVGIY